MKLSANYQEGSYSTVLLQEFKLTSDGVRKDIFKKIYTYQAPRFTRSYDKSLSAVSLTTVVPRSPILKVFAPIHLGGIVEKQ